MSSKAPGIRDTIKVLLALLSDCGCPHVPSESFRQAKYNKPEAVEAFWRILRHLLRVLHFLESGDTRDVREVATESSSEETKTASHCVRTLALELNYHRPEFYANIDSVGSCELLLFFAWLLQATSFTSQLQLYHLQAALSNATIPLPSSKRFLMDHVEETTAALEREIQTLTLATKSHSLSLDSALRKVEWLKGTLSGNCRSVENAHKAAVKLSHPLLQSSAYTASQTRRQPLSLHDLFLLRYPEKLTACVKRLEWHAASLQNLLQWQQQEPVFWQWMESVLDQHSAAEHTTNAVESASGAGETSDAALAATELLCVETLSGEVARCQQNLTQALADKKPHIERLRRAWTSKEQSERCTKPEPPLCLPQVAVESVVWCPVQASVSSSGVLSDSPHHSLQLRTVEAVTCRLLTSTEETEKHLHSLKSAIAEYIQCHT